MHFNLQRNWYALLIMKLSYMAVIEISHSAIATAYLTIIFVRDVVRNFVKEQSTLSQSLTDFETNADVEDSCESKFYPNPKPLTQLLPYFCFSILI